MSRSKKLSRLYLLLMHLSIADLGVAFLQTLPQLIWDITQEFHGNDLVCRLMLYMQVVVIYASTYVLIVTAIDRYIAVCYPFENMRWSNRRLLLIVGLAWLVSFLLALPQLFIFRLKLPGRDNQFL